LEAFLQYLAGIESSAPHSHATHRTWWTSIATDIRREGLLDEARLALALAERATEHAKQATRPNTGRLTLGFLLESEIDGGRCVALFGIIEMPAWEGGLEVLGRPLTWHIRSSDPSNDRWTADVA
jgi:hypothetical protein